MHDATDNPRYFNRLDSGALLAHALPPVEKYVVSLRRSNDGLVRVYPDCDRLFIPIIVLFFSSDFFFFYSVVR